MIAVQPSAVQHEDCRIGCRNMLHLLLLLSSISVVTAWRWTVITTFNVSSCPVHYFGLSSNEVKIFAHKSVTVVHFHPSTLDNAIMTNDRNKIRITDVTMEMNVTLPDHMKEKLTGLTLHDTVQCAWKLASLSAEGKPNTCLYYANIGRHSVLYADGTFFYLIIRLGSKEKRYYLKTRPFYDLTGCQRNHDETTATKVPVKGLAEKCKKFKGCKSDKSVILENMCDELSQCDNRGRCLKIPDVSCTAVASLLMDNTHNLLYLSDRCTYTLLSVKELLLLGKFNYRRRTHTPFLDSLHLTVGSNRFQLLQGGRVKVNETSVNLDSSMKVFNGVELFKDENRVNVTLSLSYGAISLSFDGTVAHISAPGHSQNKGLCLPRSNLAKNRRMDLSDNSCREDFNDEKQESTDCPKLKEHCESMFANDTTGKFTKACKDLLCDYGDVDGLSCHLQAAYTLRTGISLSDQSCDGSSPCLNHYCASHEFCGLKENDETTCVCRESFINPFRKSGKYGEKTTCTVDTASVELPICLVEDKGFDVSELHLLDTQCKGHVDDDEHRITFKFTHEKACGAKISANKSHIIYKNTVTDFNPEDHTITRDDMIYLNFSCSYEQPESSPMAITILDGSMIQMFMMGLYKYSVMQKACRDPACEKELKPRDVQSLGETMWIHLDVEKLDSRVALVINSCWGSVQTSGEGKLKHKLITNGCADRGDRTVKVIENGDGDHCSFSFKVFRFLKHPGEVHMHCTVSLCLKGENNRCRPKCGGKSVLPGIRAIRSVASLGTATFTSVSWIDQGALVQ